MSRRAWTPDPRPLMYADDEDPDYGECVEYCTGPRCDETGSTDCYGHRVTRSRHE